MLQIEWPWVWLLLPLPLLAYYLLPAQGLNREAALRVPQLDDFRHEEVAIASAAAPRWRYWLWLVAWLLLVLAASRPQWLDDAVAIPVSGRDLMLAVDLSDSMRNADFELDDRQVNRLEATRAVASEFIERRRGDRLGLILFGTQAYLQTPLTFDDRTVRRLLLEAAIGLAGERTAIGDAIGLAVKRLDSAASDSRVLILMTDGANTAGEISPLRAAELAASRGLRIYTIGIGADEELDITWFGLRRRSPSSQLDEETLTQIAEISGGRYFRARDSEGLAEIYRLLDELEPVEADAEHLRPTRVLFMWPLAAALCVGAMLLLPALRGRA